MHLSRREFVKTGMALSLAGAAASEAPGETSPDPDLQRRRPNILIIHGDQHRADCLGAYGNTEIHTPNLDALAGAGVRFDASFCPYPVCTPSRYSLLSGRYVHEHLGWNNHCTLSPDIPSFPRLLRDAGYRTRAVGKMHFTPTYLDMGFEEMFLAEQDGDGRWDDDYHRDLMRNGLIDLNDLEDQRSEYRKHARPGYRESFGALPSNLPEPWDTTSWIGDRAAEALESWSGEGNLLMAGFVKPHHPFDPPQSRYNACTPEKLTLLPGWTDACFPHDLALDRGYFPHEQLTAGVLRRVMACYYAAIEQIDEQVGRMVRILKEKGLYDDTMIVYTSDHGEYMGFHHMLLKGNYMYDPLVRVPLVIKYPSRMAAEKTGLAGQASDRLVSNVALAPPLLAAAGIAAPAAMSGRNLADDGPDRDIVFCESGRDLVMARSRTSKLILDREYVPLLFFDLKKDPLEMENRIGDAAYGGEIERLRGAAGQWRPAGTRQKPWLDESAPVIRQANVPPRDNSHRAAMIAYYQKQWEEHVRNAPSAG